MVVTAIPKKDRRLLVQPMVVQELVSGDRPNSVRVASSFVQPYPMSYEKNQVDDIVDQSFSRQGKRNVTHPTTTSIYLDELTCRL